MARWFRTGIDSFGFVGLAHPYTTVPGNVDHDQVVESFLESDLAPKSTIGAVLGVAVLDVDEMRPEDDETVIVSGFVTFKRDWRDVVLSDTGAI